MEVLMTADTVGGVWTYSLELARGLQPHGVSVALATMGAPISEQQREEVALLPNVELFESSYRLEWMDDPWRDVHEAGEWLLDIERRVQPDVIHLNGYAHGALPWRAPVLVAGHSCVLSWWEAVKGESVPLEWNRYRAKIRKGLQAADLVVSPTGAMLAALRRYYGPLPDTKVIYNGRDVSAFRPATKEPFILTVGRLWDDAKNVCALANVAPTLLWPTLVVGDMRHPNGGQVELAGVQALGHLSARELASCFAAAAIYALPARYEPFGLSALEAALSGCALVLGDIQSLREVWGDAALFVAPDDQQALRSTLHRLIESEDLRQEMAAHARRRALRFSTDAMAQGYLSAYRHLIAGFTSIPQSAFRNPEAPACAS